MQLCLENSLWWLQVAGVSEKGNIPTTAVSALSCNLQVEKKFFPGPCGSYLQWCFIYGNHNWGCNWV